VQRKYQIWIVTITALLMVAEHYFRIPAATTAARQVRVWGIIIAAFALGLGTINLALIHIERIRTQKQGWGNSIVLLTGLVVFTVVGVSQGTGSPTYTTLFNTFIAPMAVALFGTLIFYIVSAGYRAFVIRKTESAVILVTALIIMLAQIPIGRMISPMIPQASAWIQNIPNNAGQRGLIIGAAVGAVANGLRIMLGLERHFGG